MKNQYTFWKLLSEKQVVIPIIQRDYAQGREDKEYIRKIFLEQLGKALGIIESKDDEEKKAELDFVYGTEIRIKEKANKEIIEMLPLDGQQRLTTLWLLHWYVAYKSGKILEEKIKNTLKKFSYETRTSCREFCNKICDIEFQPGNKMKIADYIKKQTWFYSMWNQDPTIKSMIRMLSGTDNSENKNKEFIDGIEELFSQQKDFCSCWEKLTNDSCPIYFNFLPLQSSELPLSDDLYIKMNARGKPLTSFENFKADLVKWIYEDENKKLFSLDMYKQDQNRAEYISLIDNQWTDVFWQKGKDLKSVDELYFAFLNRFFLNKMVTEIIDPQTNAVYTGDFFQNGRKNVINGKTILERHEAFDYFYGTYYENYRTKNSDNKISYNDFAYYRDIMSVNLLEELKKIFKIIALNEKLSNLFPCRVEKKNDFFIPSYTGKTIEDFNHTKINEISGITLEQRVVFYAICAFYKKTKEFDAALFKNWMRVVWNIVENANEDSSISGYVGVLRLIHELSEGCLNIYSFLQNEKYLKSTNEQLKEEAIKAQQIILKEKNQSAIGPDEDAIIEAEAHAFFNGSIRFLYTDDNSNIEWKDFNYKWKNAKSYFEKEGIKDDIKCDLITALVKAIPQWELLYDRQIFTTKAEIWKRKILCNSEYLATIHNLLICNNLNLISYSIMSADDYVDDYRVVRDQLCSSGLLSIIINIHNEFRFKWNGPLAMYRPYGGQGEPIVFDFFSVNRSRNSILNILLDSDNNIEVDKIIAGTSPRFFYGWDVSFTYFENGRKYEFCWQYTNWVDMYENNEKLYDRGGSYQQLHTCLNGKENESFSDAVTLVKEIRRCISDFEDFKKNNLY